MAAFSFWFASNWFNAVTLLVAIVSLLYSGINSHFMAIGYRDNCNEQKVKNLFSFEARHRELWGPIKQRPELKRILAEKVDLVALPLTSEEDVTMWEVIQQFETTWEAENILKRGKKLEVLAKDAGAIFSLPLPHAAWEKEKEYHLPEFVRFVDRAIERRGRLSGAGD